MWTEGRQGSGYYKIKIFESKRFKFDIYLLKFPTGSHIDTHKDPAPEGYKHRRLNIILKKANKGGTFFSGSRHCTSMYPDYNRVILFRPDVSQHSVSEVKSGTRYVLSIGWLSKKRYKGEY